MRVIARVVFAAFVCAASAHAAAADTALFRLFLLDGSSLVTYGEFVRVDDRVIFSMVVGGTGDTPRLQAVTLPADLVDWTRTDRHAASTRYQQYALTRGEADFLRLSNDVAGLINDILLTTDPGRALDLAEQARATLVDWPTDHYGYRQDDVREIVALLDEAISNLRTRTGVTSFDVSLVAMAPPIPLEPVALMPSPREQIDQLFRIAELVPDASDRVALLQSALALLGEAAALLPRGAVDAWRALAEERIAAEREVDARYADLTRRLIARAGEAAADARVADVQQLLNQIPREDERLGARRPNVVQALRASVRAQLDAARELRLLRDQWTIRRDLYRQYQRAVGAQLLQLAKTEPALEAIRRLEGPSPDALVSLRAQLRGGAERLERIRPPSALQTTHDLLLGAWRFAENAVTTRYRAAESADVDTAWEASSAAAGALLLFSRAQAEIRALLEPPQLR